MNSYPNVMIRQAATYLVACKGCPWTFLEMRCEKDLIITAKLYSMAFQLSYETSMQRVLEHEKARFEVDNEGGS